MIKMTGFGKVKGSFTLPLFSEKLDTVITDNILPDIVDYLANANHVYGYMGYTMNDKGESIIQDSIYTDGVWVWPNYYKYFLAQKICTRIEADFLSYMKDNDFKSPKINQDDIVKIENFILSQEIELEEVLECTEKEKREQQMLIYKVSQAT